MNTTKEKLDNGQLEYYMPRMEGDPDLVDIMCTVLRRKGMAKDRIETFLAAPEVIDAADKASNAQRWLLNKYWRFQLLTVEKDTLEERFALTEEDELSVWISLFEHNVLPTLMHYGLPK